MSGQRLQQTPGGLLAEIENVLEVRELAVVGIGNVDRPAGPGIEVLQRAA